MSHAMGAVRFPDGLILYYEYDGTSDFVISCLHDSKAEVSAEWRKHSPRVCTCPKMETVEIYADYGNGFSWVGLACRICRAVAGCSRHPFEIEWGEPDDFGLPRETPRELYNGIPDWWYPKRAKY